MSANNAIKPCFTTNVVFLEPTEEDAYNGIVYFHPDLAVQTGTRVQIIEYYDHGVRFQLGQRTGVAPRNNFSIFTEVLPTIPEEPLCPTPPRRVNFDDHSENNVESSTPADGAGHVSIEMPRGDDIAELNDTMQAMDLAEKPVISSTPAPNLIFRARQGTSGGQKRTKADSTMLDADDISDRNTSAILAKFDTLGRQLTKVIADAVVNINTNTNGAISQQTDTIVAKLQSCYENGIHYQTSVHTDIIKAVQNSQSAIQQQQSQLLSKFHNLAQSTKSLGANLVRSPPAHGICSTTESPPTKTVVTNEATEVMSDINSKSESDEVNAVGCSYLPPSSNESAIQSELSASEDKATQDSLKFIRTHPEKVPRWSAYDK